MDGFEGIPTPRTPEDAQRELDAVYVSIEGINSRILLLQMQRQYYEQMGHKLVGLMYGAES